MALYRRPPDGQWARTGTVDSSIVRFLLPIGGAASLRLPWRLPFHIKNRHGQTVFKILVCPQRQISLPLFHPPVVRLPESGLFHYFFFSFPLKNLIDFLIKDLYILYVQVISTEIFYMKYSVNAGNISSFVVDGTGSV